MYCSIGVGIPEEFEDMGSGTRLKGCQGCGEGVCEGLWAMVCVNMLFVIYVLSFVGCPLIWMLPVRQ